MKIRSKTMFALFTLMLSGQLIGCSGGAGDDKLPLVPVKGKVTLDGKPHGPATLTLQPTGGPQGDPRPVIGGVVEADGSFALTTYNTGDGAPVGEYEAKLNAAQTGDSTDPMQAMAAMGGGGPSTAPLKVTIPEGGSTSLELKFVGAPEKKKKTGAGGTPAPL